MASAIEALGLSLPNSSAQEAVSDQKRKDCLAAGETVVRLIERGIKPSDILSREAFGNAITVTIALEAQQTPCSTCSRSRMRPASAADYPDRRTSTRLADGVQPANMP